MRLFNPRTNGRWLNLVYRIGRLIAKRGGQVAASLLAIDHGQRRESGAGFCFAVCKAGALIQSPKQLNSRCHSTGDRTRAGSRSRQ